MVNRVVAASRVGVWWLGDVVGRLVVAVGGARRCGPPSVRAVGSGMTLREQLRPGRAGARRRRRHRSPAGGGSVSVPAARMPLMVR